MSASASLGEPERSGEGRHPGRRWRHDTRGAVYVEFLIAFFPVYVMFLCLLQLGLLFTARLFTAHAAFHAARAAAVVIGDDSDSVHSYQDQKHFITDNGDRRRAVYNAALISLAPLILNGVAQGVRVLFPESGTPGGRVQTGNIQFTPIHESTVQKLRVRVEVDAMCQIALANRIMCHGAAWGLLSTALVPTHLVAAEAIYPYQGAEYDP
jgi:hypothetical protein